MREIKFRAWDKKKEEMFYDGDFYYPKYYDRELKEITEACKITNIGIIFWVCETELEKATEEYFDHKKIINSNIESMQYTGLKDKNDEEIYEGDIIKGLMDGNLQTNYIAKVIYDKGCFVDNFLGKSLKRNKYHGELNLEVIGNKYENPELLEN